ncbi:MAG: carboxypeptidase regulatory-like domain-containing protein [Bacteroidales bacterium]|jgi:hypothetical protein|nr:carboxypeptidase regulatory-like domain-containing protein [Bacteroidales bacterium]
MKPNLRLIKIIVILIVLSMSIFSHAQNQKTHTEKKKSDLTLVCIGDSIELPGTPCNSIDYYWKNSLYESLPNPKEIGQAFGSRIVQVAFDADGLRAGTYNELSSINSNDQSNPMKEVPVTLEIKNFNDLPFIEDWSSGGFEFNDWSFDPDQSNWSVTNTYGNPAPSAMFNWEPALTDYNYALVTPTLNATGIIDNVTLKFDLELNNYSTLSLECMAVEVFDGSAWQTVHDYTNLNSGFPFINESFNLTSIVAGHTFNVRFRAHGEHSFSINYWNLDNIMIYQQVVGNLIGAITRLSDGSPVEDALITINNNLSGTYTATSGADGLYTIIGAESGNYVFTLEKDGFNAIEEMVTIIGNQTVTRNYALTAPVIGVEPDSLTVTVAIGDTTTREVVVTNTGNGPLNWSSYIHPTSQKFAVPASDGKFQRGTAPVSIGRASGGNSIPSKSLNGFTGSPGYAFEINPGANFFSFNTDDPSTQNVISPITIMPFGGTFDAINTDFMYIIDNNDFKLKKVAIATGTVVNIGLCIPVDWSQIWSGITVDKRTNIMYGMSTNMDESYIYTIDKATGSSAVIGPTGIPCAIDVTIDGTGQMYTFDITMDEAYKVNKITGEATLFGSIGFDANYSQGMGWDPVTDNVYLAAYNNVTGSGELRILDRETGNTTLIGEMGGEIDGLAFPGSGFVKWATIEPAYGEIPAGDTEVVTITFDGAYIPPQKDLTLTADLVFKTIPDIGSPEVALSMTITGSFFGILEGTVTHGGTPVEGVTVTATRSENPAYTYSMVTGANGVYTFPETLYGTYDLIAVKAGFNPFALAEPLIVTGDQTTVYNIAIVAPIIVIDPLEINEWVPFGTIVTKTITITNTGDGVLDWDAVTAITGKPKVTVPESDGKFPCGTAAISIGRAPTYNSIPYKSKIAPSGTTGYAFDINPGYTFFSFDTDDPATHNVISPIDYTPFGGTFEAVNTSFMFVIDYNTNWLKKVEIATGNVTDIGYCNPYGYQSWTGITVDKTTNIMYGISTDLVVSFIYYIDMATGATTLIGPTDIPGAIDLTIDGTGQMYSFDIVNDESYRIDKETGVSTLLGSIGYDANYAQGMGWDPISDNIFLAAYNNATESGELRILDRVNGNSTLVGSMGGEIDGIAFPGGGTPSWLSIDKESGTLQAGGYDTITVTLDGTIHRQ